MTDIAFNGKTYRHDVHGWWRVFDSGSVFVNHVGTDVLDEIARLQAELSTQRALFAGDKANLDEVHELLDLIHENGIHDLDQYPVERMQTTLGRVLCEVLHELETLREGDR